jgi:hypothetical protein
VDRRAARHSLHRLRQRPGRALQGDSLITDVEIAFRESIYTQYAGPQLLDHVSSVNPTVDIRAPFTPPLGFRMGEGLYAVTARHVLFPENQGNGPYSYVGTFFPREDERNSDHTYKAGPKKDVVLMGTEAFTNFLESIQAHIGTLSIAVGILEKRVMALMARSEGGRPSTEQDTNGD